MKLRQAIRKAVALGTGALMLGATILGASADLSDYPSQFIKDGQVDAKIVVGEKAATIDVVGAIDIAADLQAAAVSETAVSVDGAGVSVTGGKTEEVAPGSALNAAGAFGATVDDDDVPSLQDTELSIDINDVDGDYDVSDTIALTAGIAVQTGLEANDEDFKDKVFMTVSKNSVKYVYSFDEALATGNHLDDASSTDPIDIEFLGRDLSITGATDDSITVEIGKEYFLEAGESVEVSGKTVKLVKTSDSAAVVDVDGDIGTITDGSSSKKIGGIKIKIDKGEIFNDDGTEFDSATLRIGDDITKTYNDGDEYIGEDEDDPDWVWEIITANGTQPSIGISYDQTLDDYDEVLFEGDELSLPDGFATISITSLNQASYQDYEISVATEELKDAAGEDLAGFESAEVLHFESMGGSDNGFVTVDGIESDDIYVLQNGTALDVFYKDSDDNKIKDANHTITAWANNTVAFAIDYKDSNIDVDVSTNSTGDGHTWTLVGQGVSYVTEEAAAGGILYVGDSDGDTLTTGDVVANGTDISGWEEDTMTNTGIKLMSYEDSDSGDAYKFSIPKEVEDFVANVVIAGSDAVVASGGSSVTTEKVNPVGVDFAVLDSDFTAGSSNSIIVGGPCANTAAAAVMGNPSDCAEGFEEGTAKLALFDDNGKVALLVAGYTGEDTLSATRALITLDLPAADDAKVTTTNSANPTVE